ncbi:MAG: efflux RND transporter periplasmic adaptor subunit [Pseudomonadales bacterium]|nr:efflux RND transporter periplasmic adaptor subunit [Pseudomonadales bacterium]
MPLTTGSASSHTDDFNPIPRRRGRRYAVLAVLLALVAGGYYYWQQQGEEESGVQPLIVSVEIGSIENAVASAGSLKPSSFVDVGAQVSGQLDKLHVEIGDRVKQGQLLAEIDARVQLNRVEASRANIAALEAQISARQAELVLASSNKARQEQLMGVNAASKLDYDTAVNNLAASKSALAQLEAQIIQSRATLASDETTLEFSRIYAPASGTVVAIEMNEGRTLNATQQAPTILRIANLSTMTVETDISEADIGKLKQGMDVYFMTLGGDKRRWYGKLRQILPTPVIENNVVLYTGLFDVDNQDGALLPEMTAQVFFITSAAENVLTVPLGALTFKDQPQAGGGPKTGSGARMPGSGFAGAGSADGTSPRGLPAAGGTGPRSGPAGQRPAGGNFADRSRPEGAHLATVQIVNGDGSISEKEVLVGVSSRIAAEVISGLKAGDRVVAGILQPGGPAPGNNAGGPPIRPGGFGGGGGGFRPGGFR